MGSLSLLQVLTLLCSVGSGAVFPLQDLLRVVEAARELLVQERQKKLQLEMRLREEICNEMLEHMQQKEQWWRYHLCCSPLSLLRMSCSSKSCQLLTWNWLFSL